MATEKAPETSSTSKSDAEVFQLEALSLNYLRSQNVSAIPDDDHIPKLDPCKLCNKAIFGFRFEAFTVLCCGHLFHRICLETYIMQEGVRGPSCPTCNWYIEINRQELGLSSGKCYLAPKSPDRGQASQQSNVTIDNDDGGLEEMIELGLIGDESSEQVSKEDRGTSPIANISVTTHEQATSPIPDNSTCNRATGPIMIEDTSTIQEDSGNQANKNNESNTNEENVTKGSKPANSEDQTSDTTKTRSSRQSSPKITREQDKLQELLRELSTPTKGESTETNDDEETEGSISHSLARLYQKAMKAGLRATKANQEEISCWYSYAKGCEDRVREIMENDRRLNGQQAMSRVYDEVKNHLPDTTLVNLRKKTQKARVIYKLFVEIGVGKIKRIRSFSADAISRLGDNQIKSIIDSFSGKNENK